MERDLSEPGRGEYVTYREHMIAKEEAAKKMAALELEQASQRAALMHLPEDVRQLTQAVNGLASKMVVPVVAPQNDALAGAVLAMHRSLDAMQKQAPPATTATELLKLLNTPPPGSSGKTWLLVGVLATVAALLAWQAFSG
jgi:hypothetical protein